MDLPQESLEEWPCQHIDFSPVKPMLGFSLQNYERIMHIALSHHSLDNLLQQPQETKTPSLCEEHSHEIWKMEENPNHYYFSSNNMQAQGIWKWLPGFLLYLLPFHTEGN